MQVLFSKIALSKCALTNNSYNVCKHVIPTNVIKGGQMSKTRCFDFASVWSRRTVRHEVNTKFA